VRYDPLLGEPKGVQRDNGGHLVALKYSIQHVFGVTPNDVWWAASDVVRARLGSSSCMKLVSMHAGFEFIALHDMRRDGWWGIVTQCTHRWLWAAQR